MGLDQVLPGPVRPWPERAERRAIGHELQPVAPEHATDALDLVEIAADPRGLGGELLREVRLQRRAALDERVRALAERDVHVGARRELAEFELAAEAQPLVDAPQRLARPQLAEVVDARAEAEPVEREALRVAAGDFVRLADRHAEPGPRERQGGAEPARAGSDQQYVRVGGHSHGEVVQTNWGR